MSYQSKEQKALMKAKVEKALADYAAGIDTTNSGWNILRYWDQGYITYTDAFFEALNDGSLIESFKGINGNLVKPSYRVLRAAKAGLLAVDEKAFA